MVDIRFQPNIQAPISNICDVKFIYLQSQHRNHHTKYNFKETQSSYQNFKMSPKFYLSVFRQFKYWETFCILLSVKLVFGDTEVYSQPKTYIITPSNSNSNLNLSNETYIYQPGVSQYPDNTGLSMQPEVQDLTYNPYSYYYAKNSHKYRSPDTAKPYYYPEDNYFKYSKYPGAPGPRRRHKKTKSRRRQSNYPYSTIDVGQYDTKWYDPSYPNTGYKPKASLNHYGSGSYGHKSKTKYGSKQKFPVSADYDNDLSLDSIFDLSDDDLEDLDSKAEDLLFGDYQDPLQEETFVRPTIVGLGTGANIAAAGLNGISHVLPGVGFGGLRGLILGTVLGLPRFSAGKLIGGGIRIFIALMLLPLILLFLPLPMFSPPQSTTTNSQRNSEDDHGATSKPPSNQILEFGRRVLSSEDCIERISCEINHFNEITGMEAENIWFSRFMHIVSTFEGFFPSFLIRMARGYMSSTGDNSCSRFECQGLSNHLNFT